MERLLTTRDLQEILQVDRITVYRMLEAGELPGIKVGGQWRFPEQEVKNWLERIKTKHRVGEAAPYAPPSVGLDMPSEEALNQPLRLTELVSNACLQRLQDGFAEAVGVASLITDGEGTPVTSLSNACSFCRLGRTSPEFRRRCSQSWLTFAHVKEEQPTVRPCHAGIGYAVSPVEVHGKPVGLVVGGQFWPKHPDQQQARERALRLAAECSLPGPELAQALDTVPVFTQERAFLFTRLLATIANTVSEIGFQAYAVNLKLKQIAQIVKTLEP
ncbi:MAG: PocR ligand-binding domain-containing protein [Dehalococcoidales bacterium]|nr:PocR ligand-binding domain-containing protein [Dehalococcoidales bacterium]